MPDNHWHQTQGGAFRDTEGRRGFHWHCVAQRYTNVVIAWVMRRQANCDHNRENPTVHCVLSLVEW
jgi:hypothetical protein